MLKKSPGQFEQSHRVILSAANGLRMTGRDLSGDEELSRSLEPCLRLKKAKPGPKIIAKCRIASVLAARYVKITR